MKLEFFNGDAEGAHITHISAIIPLGTVFATISFEYSHETRSREMINAVVSS